MMNTQPNSCTVCLRKAEENKPLSIKSYYGAFCCFACSDFFRRSVRKNGRENLDRMYPCECLEWKDSGLEYRCRNHRMAQCIRVGMDPQRVGLDETSRNIHRGMIKKLLLWCKYPLNTRNFPLTYSRNFPLIYPSVLLKYDPLWDTHLIKGLKLICESLKVYNFDI